MPEFEEYEVVAALLADAELKKAHLLDGQQSYNQATISARKVGLQNRIDSFVAVRATADPRAAAALQKHIDGLQGSYDYWDGPEPPKKRAGFGQQIAEVSQLIEQLTDLLDTLPEPPPEP